MRKPFIRPLRRASWSPGEWAGPIEGYTLRECYVLFLLCPLPASIRHLLLDWLLDPTDPRRWPTPNSVPERRLPFAASDVQSKTRKDYYKLLRDELAAIRHTLDFPPEVMSGLTRYGVLVAHGARLRQLAGAMPPRMAEEEMKQMIA
jgi:hypothetical protein